MPHAVVGGLLHIAKLKIRILPEIMERGSCLLSWDMRRIGTKSKSIMIYFPGQVCITHAIKRKSNFWILMTPINTIWLTCLISIFLLSPWMKEPYILFPMP